MTTSLRFLTSLLVSVSALLASTAFAQPGLNPLEMASRAQGLPTPRPSFPMLNTLTEEDKAEGWHLLFDGKSLDEPWQTVRDGTAYPGDFESVTLGPDEYYLMGDNRPNSEDSRYTGPVRRGAMLAKVRTIWLHYSPTQGIDTSRIGLSVDAPAR